MRGSFGRSGRRRGRRRRFQAPLLDSWDKGVKGGEAELKVVLDLLWEAPGDGELGYVTAMAYRVRVSGKQKMIEGR